MKIKFKYVFLVVIVSIVSLCFIYWYNDRETVFGDIEIEYVVEPKIYENLDKEGLSDYDIVVDYYLEDLTRIRDSFVRYEELSDIDLEVLKSELSDLVNSEYLEFYSHDFNEILSVNTGFDSHVYYNKIVEKINEIIYKYC